jgi:hypothetical protein
MDFDNNIISINKFLELDKDFNIINSKIFDVPYDSRSIIGIEDLRLFQPHITTTDKDTGPTGVDIKDTGPTGVDFIATCYQQNNKIGICSGIYNLNDPILTANEIESPFGHSCEKNWVYFSVGNSSAKDFNIGEKYIIYNWNPLQIYKYNSAGKGIELVKIISMPPIFKNCRGSTCGFNFSSEIWFIVHIVSEETPRHYYHIISVFDTNMNLIKYSAPFKFEGEPIEYCLSIILDYEKIIINYSTWDRTTKIGVYDKKYIDSLLKYTAPRPLSGTAS